MYLYHRILVQEPGKIALLAYTTLPPTAVNIRYYGGRPERIVFNKELGNGLVLTTYSIVVDGTKG